MKPHTQSSIFPSNKKKAKKIARGDIRNKLRKRRSDFQKSVKELEAEPLEKPIYMIMS